MKTIKTSTEQTEDKRFYAIVALVVVIASLAVWGLNAIAPYLETVKDEIWLAVLCAMGIGVLVVCKSID